MPTKGGEDREASKTPGSGASYEWGGSVPAAAGGGGEGRRLGEGAVVVEERRGGRRKGWDGRGGIIKEDSKFDHIGRQIVKC